MATKRKKRGLTEIEKWRAEMLAKNGGFSIRAIASRVFDRKIDKVSPQEESRITTFLRSEKLKVTDWRTLKSFQAVQYATTVTKEKEKKERKRKTA